MRTRGTLSLFLCVLMVFYQIRCQLSWFESCLVELLYSVIIDLFYLVLSRLKMTYLVSFICSGLVHIGCRVGLSCSIGSRSIIDKSGQGVVLGAVSSLGLIIPSLEFVSCYGRERTKYTRLLGLWIRVYKWALEERRG